MTTIGVMPKYTGKCLGGAPNSARPSGVFGTYFDGTTAKIDLGALPGTADGKCALVSLWFKRNRTGLEVMFSATGAPGKVYVAFNAGNQIVINCRNATPTTILTFTSVTTITDTKWHHLLFSADMANSANRGVYIDDVLEANTWSVYTNDTIDFTINYKVAADGAGTANFFQGALQNLYFTGPATYYDVSVEANRRKFIQSNLVPAETSVTGADGSLVTGSIPWLFLTGIASTWHINDGGSGTTFTASATISQVTGPRNYG